jgi:outer membrane immunogenic protein
MCHGSDSRRTNLRKQGQGMKNIMLAGVGAALMAISAAKAADLGRPTYKAPPPTVPVFSWSGCYIGANIGGGWGRKDISIPNLATAAEIPASEVTFAVPPVRADTRGVVGGGQVGCNYQFASNWVIGVEGDGSGADIHGDVTAPPVTFVVPPGTPFPPGPVPISSSFHAQTDWLASLTGRAGYAAGPWLFYAKGGVAWAGDKYAADIPIFQEHLGASETRTGWTVGGGVEWAFFNNWSAKVEYDFYDFGNRSVTLAGFFPGVGPSTFPAGASTVPGVDIKQTISVVKFGVNYRFAGGNGLAPSY